MAGKTPKRSQKFHHFSDCIRWLKKSVYAIARGRPTVVDGKETIQWNTLGSGFIAAPNRLLTAAHVINDPANKSEHRDGDWYYLIRHDDDDNWHFRRFQPKMNSEIFLYPDIDLGIIYLEDAFYKDGANIFADKNDFIRISQEQLPIGAEVGVLGYPLCKLEFENGDISKPIVGNLLLRTDRGVVNSKYRTQDTNSWYEFTLSFNPGNSGGPIFDSRTGRLVSMVKGFRTHTLKMIEKIVGDKEAETFNIKELKGKPYIEVLHASYSMGLSTTAMLEALKEHKVI